MAFGLICALCCAAVVVPSCRSAADSTISAIVRRLLHILRNLWDIDYSRFSRYLPVVSLAICVVGAVHGFHQIPQYVNWADESLYVRSGIALASGHWPTYDLFPSTSFFYAAMSAITGSHTISFLAHRAHVITFILTWVVITALAMRTNPLLAVLATISNVPPALTFDTADALFCILTMAAIGAILQPSPYAAIVLTTFAAMARPDGLWISLLLIGYCTLKLGRRKGDIVSVIFAAILLVDFTAEALVNHTRFTPFTGMKKRAYTAFVQGEGVSYSDFSKDRDAYHTGNRIAPVIYGSAEANNWSIPTAIAHNPAMFARRVHHNLYKLPRQLEVDLRNCPMEGIGQFAKGAPGIVAFIMLLGFVAAAVSPRRQLYLVFSLPFCAYVLTFYRDGYVFAYGPIFTWIISDAFVQLSPRCRCRSEKPPTAH